VHGKKGSSMKISKTFIASAIRLRAPHWIIDIEIKTRRCATVEIAAFTQTAVSAKENAATLCAER